MDAPNLRTPEEREADRAKELREKRTKGFHPLKDGCVHIRCWNCGMKRSNVPRADYDPPRAFLAETPCPKCCDRLHAFEPGVDWYDANGDELSDAEVQQAYENFETDKLSA